LLPKGDQKIYLNLKPLQLGFVNSFPNYLTKTVKSSLLAAEFFRPASIKS